MECEIAVNFSECRNERGNLFFLTNGGRSHLADATVGPRDKLQAISHSKNGIIYIHLSAASSIS